MPDDYLVLVADEYASDLSAVTERLKALGVKVRKELKTLATISISLNGVKLDDVKNIEGVLLVNPHYSVRIK